MNNENSKDEKRKMKRLTCALNYELFEELDSLKEVIATPYQLYPTRSDVVRTALEKGIAQIKAEAKGAE